MDDWQTKRFLHPGIDLAFGLSQNFEEFVKDITGIRFGEDGPLYFAVGAPKLDPMLSGAFDREKVLGDLGLPPDRKTILVTSHWKENSVLTKWGARIVEELAPLANECNIVVTAHGNLWDRPATQEFDPMSLELSIKRIAEGSNFIAFEKSGSASKLLYASDILICDNSSIAVEFSTLDRPLVFYKNAGENMRSDKVRHLYEDAAHCFSTPEDLRGACQIALDNPTTKSEARQRMARYFIDNPGHASEATVRLLKTLGRLSGPRSRNWARAVALSQTWKGARTAN